MTNAIGDRNVERVTTRLREAILAGRLGPGAPIREMHIAHELGVSRTPVRQALRLLADLGLVVLRPNRGAVVATWSREALLEVAEVRSHLGSLAGRRAAETIDAENLTRLRDLASEIATTISLRKSDGAQALSEALLDFHRTIFHASGNALLARLFDETTYVQVVATTFRHYGDDDLQRIAAYPGHVVTALADRDGELAAALISAYFRQARRAISAATADLAPSSTG